MARIMRGACLLLGLAGLWSTTGPLPVGAHDPEVGPAPTATPQPVLTATVVALQPKVSAPQVALAPRASGADTTLVRRAAMGESLDSIAQQTGFSLRELATRNRVAGVTMLTIGQALQLPAPVKENIKLVRVSESDTMVSLAAQYNVAPGALALANLLPCGDCIVPGQVIRVPLLTATSSLPAPFEDIQVSPLYPSAGDVVTVRVRTSVAPKVLVGEFDGRPLRFVREANDYVAIIGLPPSQVAGSVPVLVHLTDSTDIVSTAGSLFPVGPSGYVTANVTVGSDLLALLQPLVNDLEALDLANIYAGWSEPQRWTGPFHLPNNDEITGYYGSFRTYNGGIYQGYHSGMDVRAWTGTPSRAAAPGRVVVVKRFAVRGLTVIVDHGRGVYTAYCHNSEVLVKEGDEVATGDILAKSGTTGRSEGPHIHFELAVGGAQVEPLPWLAQTLP